MPQASLIKGRFGGIVNIVEDISPPPATIKKRKSKSDFLYGSGGRYSNGEAVEPIPNKKKRRPKVEQ